MFKFLQKLIRKQPDAQPPVVEESVLDVLDIKDAAPQTIETNPSTINAPQETKVIVTPQETNDIPTPQASSDSSPLTNPPTQPTHEPLPIQVPPTTAEPVLESAAKLQDTPTAKPKPPAPQKRPKQSVKTTEPPVDPQQLVQQNLLCLLPASPHIIQHKQLLKHIVQMLSADEKMRLSGLFFDALDAANAPHQAILSLLQANGQAWGQWALIKLNPHNLDEFEWQAQEIAYNWQLPDDFEWETPQQTTKANVANIIQNALDTYAQWLSQHEFSLLTLQDAPDTQIGAFILPEHTITDFKHIAQSLKLKYTHHTPP